MSSLKTIATAWGKKVGLLSITPQDKAMAVQRIKVCVGCPYAKEGWLSTFVDNMMKRDEIGSGIVCSKCGCPINAKALEPKEDCPMGYWPKINETVNN